MDATIWPPILYLRVKVGFCNCTTGIADHEELEVVGDVDLIDSQSSTLCSCGPILHAG
jgi:hypothetical protein